MMIKMNTVAFFTVAIHILLSSFHPTMALDCVGKWCSYEYKYRNTDYRWCTEKWGSKPATSYKYLSRIGGTGKSKKCTERNDIERRYANNNPGNTCNMRKSKGSTQWDGAYSMPCYDSAARRLDVENDDSLLEKVLVEEVTDDDEEKEDDEEEQYTNDVDINNGNDDDDEKKVVNLGDDVDDDDNDNHGSLRRRLGSWEYYKCESDTTYRKFWPSNFSSYLAKSSAATKSDAFYFSVEYCCEYDHDGFALKRYTTIFGTKDWYYKCADK